VQTRALGRTGLRISEIVFGAGAVGGAVFTGPPEDRTAVVRRALEAGINWIDTASSYGDGQSEENLGRILDELGASPQLSTKVRLADDDFGDVASAVERSIAASLGRLRRPGVELIQLHNRIEAASDPATGAIGVDDVLGAGGVLDGFERARARGQARFFGFTALGDLESLRALVDSGRFDTAQVYHNVLNPSASRPVPTGASAYDYGGLVQRAAGQGMGVLNIRVLAAGAVAGDARRAGGRPLSPGSEGGLDVERAERLRAAWEGEPGTMAQRAIRFALDTPGVSGVLVGVANLEQVDEAVEAASMPPLSERAMRALEGLHASDFGRLD
jgi:L-galactose dehydrogenase/L-glyceraldehyde 3-phosphate reductase